MDSLSSDSLFAGNFKRVTKGPECKGKLKENGLVLVSMSLTLPFAPTRAGGSICRIPNQK